MKQQEGEQHGVDRDWKIIQKALVTLAEEVIPNVRQSRRQPCMTKEILNMMETRRELNNVSQDRYKHMDRRVKPACRLRKEEWLEAQCQEVEMLERVDSRLVAEKIREITGKKENSEKHSDQGQ